MFKSIITDIQSAFRFGNTLNRIIIINVAIFLFISLFCLVLKFSNGGNLPTFYHSFIHFFAFSSDWKEVLFHPWSFVTHMFMHEGFFHLLFNMLILYWFGKIIGDLLGDRRVLPVFIMGGFAGALSYFLSMNLFGFIGQGTSYAIGASAGVMSIVFASAVTSPNYIMRLILLGDVKIKYIALVLVLVDIFALGSMKNTGGHFGHLGGAAFGGIFVTMLRNGKDISESFNRIYDKIVNFFYSINVKAKKSPLNVVHKKDKTKKDHKDASKRRHQEQLDRILDKINKQGYSKLTDEEKEFLFQASKK